MAGTKIGGLRAAATNKKRDPDFYKKIGSAGGKKGTTGGFARAIPCDCNYLAWQHFKRECAGTRGGKISRRSKAQ